MYPTKSPLLYNWQAVTDLRACPRPRLGHNGKKDRLSNDDDDCDDDRDDYDDDDYDDHNIDFDLLEVADILH